MDDEARMKQVHEVEPGIYVFEVKRGPSGGTLTLADGREIRVGKEGGTEKVRIREPQEVVISYQTDSRPPSEINLKKVR